MPFEALRFIHASNVRIDAPLRGTGPLPDAVRRIAEDATCTSFERIVSACIERQVDFLLLTGNTFVESDQSLRARVALLRGFEQLQEHGISAYVVSGDSDPSSAWKAFAHLPDNVIVFHPEADEPVAVLRNDQLIASLAAVGNDSDQSASRNGGRVGERARRSDVRPRPFSIGVMSIDDTSESLPAEGTVNLPEGMAWPEIARRLVVTHLQGRIDYLAVGGGDVRRTARVDGHLAHNPGCAQPLHESRTGAHGCSLIEVDGEGGIHCTFLSTAAVRWETPVLDVTPETTDDTLLQNMRTVLEGHCQEQSIEQAWIVRWTICGTGALFDSLAESGVRDELAELCEVDSPLPDGVHQIHHLERQADRLGEPAAGDRLAEEYLLALAHIPAAERSVLEETFENSGMPDGPLGERLRHMIGELNFGALSSMARRLGEEWFAESLEEDAA